MRIYLSVGEDEREAYATALRARLDGTGFLLSDDAELSDIIVYSPESGLSDFSNFPNLKLVQSIWAGVDQIVGNSSLSAPLARMVDQGLSEGMREYVMGHILADHIQIDHFEREKHWAPISLPLARSKTMAMIGVGALGQSCAAAALALGFEVLGWSRTEKSLSFPCFSGKDGLRNLLARADYVVTLLPHTNETENLIDADFLSAMTPDAMLINPGRGALLDEEALIRALDDNALRRAVLDVFKTEPLPDDHPFWHHPKILVTPHIAAKSRVETVLDVVVENARRLERGEEPMFLVDRDLGY